MNKKPKNNEADPSMIDKELEKLQYPAGEDIYNKESKLPFAEEDEPEENTNALDEGLDVPGAELDDKDEAIGEEDEENNYYSLGGDDHNDLDEDQGE